MYSCVSFSVFPNVHRRACSEYSCGGVEEEGGASLDSSSCGQQEGVSDYSYGGGGGEYDSSNYGGRDVLDSLGTNSSASSASSTHHLRGWGDLAPLARLDSSSESVASAASTVIRAAVAGGGERRGTASIDSGVGMSSSLVAWPTGSGPAATSPDDVMGDSSPGSPLDITSHAVVLRGEDSSLSCADLPLDGAGGGAAGALTACLDSSTAAMAAVALASLNENLSCLSAVTHIPDANCTVQVRDRQRTTRQQNFLRFPSAQYI